MINKRYTIERDKLIPLAEEYANEQAGPPVQKRSKEREDWKLAWNKAFLSKMDSLAREKGLVN